MKITNTTVGNKFYVRPETIKEAIAGAESLIYQDSENWIMEGPLVSPSYRNDDFQTFPYPLTVKMNERDSESKELTFVDLRPFFTARGESRDIFNKQTVLKQAMLSREWEIMPRSFTHVSALTSLIFGHWFSASLNRMFTLDPREKVIARALAVLHYLRIFYYAAEKGNVRSRGVDDLKAMVIRSLNDRLAWVDSDITDTLLEMEEVNTFLETPPETNCLQQLILLLQKLLGTGSVNRMKNLETPHLITALTHGAWMGYKAPMAVSIAVEYPPYLIEIITAAIMNNNLRKNTNIGKAVDLFGKDERLDVIRKLTNEVMNDLPERS